MIPSKLSFHTEIKDLTSSEELILNTVATINNLSYYTDESGALANKRQTITQREYLVATISAN